MSDLIEREALLESVRKWIMDTSEIRDSLDHQYNKGLLRAIKEIQRAPAVDAEPVRHGKWLYGIWETYPDGHVCDQCRTGYPIRFNYCPNCGAKMDLEELK